MISLAKLLILSAITFPILAEVLTQSFVIRLKEMDQLIQDQKKVNKNQNQVIESLKTGKYNDERLLSPTSFCTLDLK